MKQTGSSTLATAVWPQASLGREALLVVGGSWFISLTAQVAFQIGPVPITGQVFGVLMVAAILGSRRGTAAVLVYLLQGAMGLPVFAGGTAGFVVLTGPTAGYLVGFIPAAFVVGWLCEKGWDQYVSTAIVAMVLGCIVIYEFGIAWLQQFVGWEQVFVVGLVPFVPGDFIKVILASILLPVGWKLIGTREG